MSKKDYIEFAKMFREYRFDKTLTEDQQKIVALLMSDVIAILSNDNPNFDATRFVSYVIKES